MTVTAAEKPHIWVHPRDRLVLGVKLSDLKQEVDKELVRFLAAEKSTAGTWLVLQAIGATDAQIEGVIRFAGPRTNGHEENRARPLMHLHWRTTFQSRGETQFWLRSKLQLSGPELVACVRRLLSIPALEPGPAPAQPQARERPAVDVELERAYAALVLSCQRREPEPCAACGGAGEIDWVCPVCDGDTCSHEGAGRGGQRYCYACAGQGGGTYPCETCATADCEDEESEPDLELASVLEPVQAKPGAMALGAWWVAGTIADGNEDTIEAGAEILVEGLADRAGAESWLRAHHPEMTAAHGYDCYCVDGCTDDAAWNSAECWGYDEGGNLVSGKDGRTL